MTRRLSLTLLATTVIVGVASLVLALMEPTSPGPWFTALGMACVAGVQVNFLRKTPPEDR